MSHRFEVQASWKEGMRGEVEPGGASPAVPFSVPKEYGGPGGNWTPEHFYAASIASCVLATFLAIAKMSKLEIASYESRATCDMEQGAGGALQVTAVSLVTRIGVRTEKDRERAVRLIEKAERLCPLSNSLKLAVDARAEVEVA